MKPEPANRALPRARDRIFLRDWVRDVEIGAFQEERGVTQRLRFNVTVDVGCGGDPADDDVDHILSYDTISQAIDFALSEERLSLLETLAERIAGRLLKWPQAEAVMIRIEKLDRGPFALGVEIERVRGGPPATPEDADRDPAPIVLHLSNRAISDLRLATWLDQLQSAERSTVLTVGMPDSAPPLSGSAMPQRRINLLAMEQNAWILAARDPRCVVVETRTEIAHAMRTGQLVVWAPSKIVLDSVDAPAAGPRDAEALVAWMAGEIGACRILGLDSDIPGGRRLDLADRLDL